MMLFMLDPGSVDWLVMSKGSNCREVAFVAFFNWKPCHHDRSKRWNSSGSGVS